MFFICTNTCIFFENNFIYKTNGWLYQVGVIGNLVHSSPNIKKEVLLAGALQPVIGLLRWLLSLWFLLVSDNFHFLNFFSKEPFFSLLVILGWHSLSNFVGLLLFIILLLKLVHSNFQSCSGQSSCCSESQREAALLLGQFAATDSDCKVDGIISISWP